MYVYSLLCVRAQYLRNSIKSARMILLPGRPRPAPYAFHHARALDRPAGYIIGASASSDLVLWTQRTL